eukprot:s6761_g4.t1
MRKRLEQLLSVSFDDLQGLHERPEPEDDVDLSSTERYPCKLTGLWAALPATGQCHSKEKSDIQNGGALGADPVITEANAADPRRGAGRHSFAQDTASTQLSERLSRQVARAAVAVDAAKGSSRGRGSRGCSLRRPPREDCVAESEISLLQLSAGWATFCTDRA